MGAADGAGPIPAWLASRIRRAALFSATSAFVPVAAVALLLAAIVLMLWLGEFESPWAPLFWVAVFVGLLYLFGRPFGRALRTAMNPARSDEVAYLRRFGPLVETVKQVEMELRHPGNFAHGTRVAFTQHWLVVSRRSRFAVRHLDDLVWAFPKTTTTRLNWVIPIWRSHAAVFRSAAGPDAEVTCSRKTAATLVEEAVRRRPWMTAGYSDDLEKAWTADRAAFVEAVQKRR